MKLTIKKVIFPVLGAVYIALITPDIISSIEDVILYGVNLFIITIMSLVIIERHNNL